MTAPRQTAPNAPPPSSANLELSSFEATVAANLIPDETTRPVYRYSVVKGGAYSPDEMAAAIEKDPVVAAHYLGLDPDTLRVERVTAPRWEYMSYRIGDDVYWTKNKIQLHVGETLLTDGNTTIRARCGNCIAAAPLGPASDEEPAQSAFTTREDDNLGLGEPDLQAALLPDVPPELIGVGNSRPITMFGPGDITLFAPGTQTQTAAGGGSGTSSVPMFVPFGGGGGGSNDTGGPENPGGPGNPGGPENPGNPGGPDNPGGPENPGGPGNPENPGCPDCRTNPGGPEEPFIPPTDNPPGGDNPVSVPEPGTLLLMAVGGAGILARRLRQRP